MPAMPSQLLVPAVLLLRSFPGCWLDARVDLVLWCLERAVRGVWGDFPDLAVRRVWVILVLDSRDMEAFRTGVKETKAERGAILG